MQNEPQIIIGKDYLPTVLPLLAAAKRTVDIIIFEWRLRPTQPDHPVSVLMRELQAATARGVRIRALVGTEIIRAELRRARIESKVLYTGKLVHAKCMVIDDTTAIIGSHNYTGSAFSKNLEISVVVQLTEAKNELTAYFNNLWSV